MSCVPSQDPSRKIEPLCRLPYAVLAVGVLIAFLGSFKLQVGATGYQVHWTLFVFGLLPYVVYSGFLIMPSAKWLAIVGILLVVADLALRTFSPGLPLLAGYGPLWLLLLLAVTLVPGVLGAARRRPETHPHETGERTEEPDNGGVEPR